MNGHVGRDADGYGGMGVGTRNAEGERIFEFDDAVGNGGVQHILQDTKLITYQSGDNISMIDYLVVKKNRALASKACTGDFK